MIELRRRAFFLTLLALACVLPQCVRAEEASRAAAQAPSDRIVYRVLPSAADPSIRRYDHHNVVMFNRSTSDRAPLVLFLPGTHGKPSHSELLLSVVANLGYRAVGLEYNDEPAVDQLCHRDPDPKCSGAVREKRIFGTDTTKLIDDTPAEAIVPRFVKLLEYLDAHHPGEHWGDYLENGQPKWSRIVVSGLSQGAGMAAYIAKHKLVARAVLFSSPWDVSAPARQHAAWIKEESATPPERWYAEYHLREKTASSLKRVYTLLRIPGDHIRVFNLDLPANYSGTSENPYHGLTTQLPGYIPEWQFLFGKAQHF